MNEIDCDFVLKVVASGAASTPEEVENYANCTLLSVSLSHRGGGSQEVSQESKDNSVRSCVKFLEENEFIRQDIKLMLIA